MDFISLGLKLIDKLLPDQAAKQAAQLKLVELQQAGELAHLQAETDLAKGQLEINKAEAMSDGWFKGGWRPALGYVCVAGLAYQFLLRPLLVFIDIDSAATPPSLELSDLMTLLFGMLGLGTLRTTEKIKGAA